MALNHTASSSTTREITAARQADYIAFLHRVPFAIDALQLGLLPGFREDCTYQQSSFPTLDVPVGMLDNDFHNPDLERYVERFFEYEPRVGVVGDATSDAEVKRYVRAAREIQASYPEAELVIVPKCHAAIEAVPDDLILGYSRGYADRLAHEFSKPADWRGRRVHILGGSPPKQRTVIQQLTQPTLTGLPPAKIVGLDWNGAHLGAQYGEFWTPDGWDDSGRNAEHMTVRKTVRHSLGRIREFWQTHGIWPAETPLETGFNLDYQGPTPDDLDRSDCTTCGTDVWEANREPYVAEYDTGGCYGYCSYECYFTHRQRNHLEELVDKRSVYMPQT